MTRDISITPPSIRAIHPHHECTVFSIFVLETAQKWTLRGRRVSLETLVGTPLTSMTLVFRFCYMSSVRSTSDGRGPVTRKRVPDREEPGKPRKDARRGRCHLLEAGLWSLWMTQLPRHSSHKSQVTSSPRRSSPRHPVAMASTAKRPYPMSCALSAVLLPESRAHG